TVERVDPVAPLAARAVARAPLLDLRERLEALVGELAGVGAELLLAHERLAHRLPREGERLARVGVLERGVGATDAARDPPVVPARRGAALALGRQAATGAAGREFEAPLVV